MGQMRSARKREGAMSEFAASALLSADKATNRKIPSYSMRLRMVQGMGRGGGRVFAGRCDGNKGLDVQLQCEGERRGANRSERSRR
eukprot:762988-Hanusia_phi.AAC.3